MTGSTVEIRQSNSVANIQKTIQETLGRLSRETNHVNLLVTGSKTDGRVPLVLTLPEATIRWEAEYSGDGLELMGEGNFELRNAAKMKLSSLTVTGDLIINVADTNTMLTINGNVTASSPGSGYLGTEYDGLIQINGSMTYTGTKQFAVGAFGLNAKTNITGNVSGTADEGSSYIASAMADGELTIGGNVSTAGEYALRIGGHGKLTVKGDVSAPNGSCAYMYSVASLGTDHLDGMGIIDGTVTTASDDSFIYSYPSRLSTPGSPYPPTTTVGNYIYYDYSMFVLEQGTLNTLWHLYIRKR